MQYVILIIVAIIALVYLWKYVLILLCLCGVGYWLLQKYKKSKEEANLQSKKATHSLVLLGDRLVIESQLKEEDEKIKLMREEEPLLDWKSLNELDLSNNAHFDFAAFIVLLASDITFFLGSEAVVDRTAVYQCADLSIDCYIGKVHIKDFSILFQWDHPDTEPDEPDRMVIVSHKSEIVMRCSEWDQEESSVDQEKTIVLLPALADGSTKEKRFVVNTFKLGEWLDYVLALEPEVMVRMRANGSAEGINTTQLMMRGLHNQKQKADE